MTNPVPETPLKRRKTSTGFVPQGYNSQDDSGDDIFQDYDTVDTVPLPLQTRLRQDSLLRTQDGLVATECNYHNEIGTDKRESSPEVQVTASSPVRGADPKTQSSLARSIAPLGTTFCPPTKVINPPASNRATPDHRVTEVETDDDDVRPQYQGDSSDNEESSRTADIKPAFFTSQKLETDAPTDSSRSFYSITANARYDAGLLKASSGALQKHQNNAHQGSQMLISEPSSDATVHTISDVVMRQNIARLRERFPHKSVSQCKDALLSKKHNLSDACEYLMVDTKVIDLTEPSDKDASADMVPSADQLKPRAKQELKGSVQKIREKWAPPKLKYIFSPPPQFREDVTPSKPNTTPPRRRRLIQGRKKASPVSIEAQNLASPSDEVSTDSGFDEQSQSEDIEDAEVRDFFNKATVGDLMDTAVISKLAAENIISQRPFASLVDVRRVREGPKHSKGRTTLGERVIGKVSEVFQGYRAIDHLITRCNEIARPLAESLSKWGINIMEKAGEIDVVDLDDIKDHYRDSGIGTPSSRSISLERDTGQEHANADVTRVSTMHKQPARMSKAVALKDYQILGMNWLFLLFQHRLSGILADDMGLGKTCQIISFLALLDEQGTKGPHLIVVPTSTLENWLREFSVFAPKLNIVPYYASQSERAEIRVQILDELDVTDVVVTTYTVAKAKEDNKFLRKLRPVCCVFDEGHMLRNSHSAGYDMYQRIPAKCRILLTGTPLQNNLVELCSLLRFILPNVFEEHMDDLNVIFGHKARTNDDESSHATLLSADRVTRAKSMMTPFVLRRKKHHVLKHLPSKTKRLQWCQLTKSQIDLYEREKARAVRILTERQTGKATSKESTNIMMALRKASIHPLLFRRIYDNRTLRDMSKACLSEDQFRESNVELIYEDMTVMDDIELHRFSEQYSSLSRFALKREEWMDSGKVKVVADLLKKFKAAGDRVLIFSQFVQVINILEYVMETLQMRFFRLDGSTRVEERQAMIDTFSEDEKITVFLLSTKAGGAGINLAAANKVIIFDSSFNPQDDIQAENRAHRVGQTREVEVVRLISQNTIEEQINALGETKLALDERVAGISDDAAAKKVENQGIKEVEGMLSSKLLKTAEAKEQT